MVGKKIIQLILLGAKEYGNVKVWAGNLDGNDLKELKLSDSIKSRSLVGVLIDQNDRITRVIELEPLETDVRGDQIEWNIRYERAARKFGIQVE